MLRPATILATSALVGSLGATALDDAAFSQYEALWFAQVAGFGLGYVVYGRSRLGAAAGARPIATERLALWGSRLWLVALLAGILFFASHGVPALGTSVEQGRVDAATSGSGYLRLLAYMATPAVLLIAAHVGWRKALPQTVITVLLILGLGNRSPLVYVLVPLVVVAVAQARQTVSTTRLAAAVVAVAVLIAAAGTYRIVNQPDFQNYAEYRVALADGDYLKVAWISTEHYAKVVPANAVLVRRLVDEGSIELQWGKTYATLFLTALPGKQLTPDYMVKEASRKSFLGGGTPPTLAGEGYMNAGLPGTILSSAVIMFVLLVWATRWDVARRAGPATVRANASMYGYLVTWAVLAQVAGVAGASTVPLAGFLVLATAFVAARQPAAAAR